MKWEIWGKDDGLVYATLPTGQLQSNGSPMVDLLIAEGHRLISEFETPEESLPEGLGPSIEKEESLRHFRVAVLMSNMYMKGVFEGERNPHRICPIHSGQVHGREAEELRARIEKCIEIHASESSAEDIANALQNILDDVDARDSLAFKETLDGRLRGYTRFMEQKEAAEEHDDSPRQAIADAAGTSEEL